MNDESMEDAEARALARDLGARAADRLDVEKTAEAVVRRLRDERHRVEQARLRRTWLPLAAAVVLLLGGGLLWRHGRNVGAPAAATALAPAGLDLNTLPADQLRDLLDAVDQPFEVDSAGTSDTSLDDLTPGELRTLLHAMEG